MARIYSDGEQFDVQEERILEGQLIGNEIHVLHPAAAAGAEEAQFTEDQQKVAIGCFAASCVMAVSFGTGMLVAANRIGESHPRIATAANIVGAAALVSAGILGWMTKRAS